MAEASQVKQALLIFLECLQDRMEHRKENVLPELKALDGRLTAQWYGVNSAKTATAGLATASFITLFFFPPVALGLGIGAGVLGAGTAIGDWIAEETRKGSFQELVKKDDEITKNYVQAALSFQRELEIAQEEHGGLSTEEILSHLLTKNRDDFQFFLDLATNTGRGVNAVTSTALGIAQLVRIAQLTAEIAEISGPAVSGTVQVTTTGVRILGIEGGAMQAGTRVVASVATKTLGGVAMGLSLLDMAYSWSTSKNVQAEIRKTIRDMEEEQAQIATCASDDSVTVEASSDNSVVA